ncbi:DUF3531 family protein [Prochlorothrix hollandica]|uniref:DUF3531 domain-containing protein n=2 Tax=Prochlorothrix hollandica TaxID=1223 RepID=A0A0M2PZ28_PROHO|nr:DUF3531 family protein [Prochlorothrix hollandica]KKJ01405.1 hypothetical protein PROH_03445 [Prochlorothrix hollandica PCC 9006 = CALU 1027]
MHVEFREFNPFDVWLWFEFSTVPSHAEQQYIAEALSSWFFMGKLGGFNAENLQIQDEGMEISYMHYDHDRASTSLVSLMHNMGDLEQQGQWLRCWFDLGTSDALALDILVNTLKGLSQEYVAIDRLIIGGENPDWPVPHEEQDTFYDNDQ